MGLFQKKEEPKAPVGIKLIQRFQFDRTHQKEGDQYDYWRQDTIKVLDTYSVNGKSYVVHTYYDDYYSFDIRDDHGERTEALYFTVFPIPAEDAQNEEKVNAALDAHIENWACKVSSCPEMKVSKDDKLFSEFIMQNIKPAIKIIKSNQKIAKLKEGKDSTPNAVAVSYNGSAYPDTVYDFATQYGLGEALSGSPTRVSIHDAQAVAELCNMSRGLCWYYNPHPKSGAAHNYPMSALLDWSIDGDLIICGKNALGKPEALNAEEIESVTAALNSYKRVFE